MTTPINTPDLSAQLHQLEVPGSHQKDYLEPLFEALNQLVWVQLGALYALDNSAFSLALRSASHITHVVAKKPAIPQLGPTLLVWVIASVFHLLSHRPSGERQHGGLLIDFVGELAPSKSKLLFLDLAVLGLQLIMLVVGLEMRPETVQSEPQPQQDLEAEEAGELRSSAQHAATETDEDIELQNLLPKGSADHPPADKSHDRQAPDDEMRSSLSTLIRRRTPAISAAQVESGNAARASLTIFLARIASARARPG
jgi:hypothetical protein